MVIKLLVMYINGANDGDTSLYISGDISGSCHHSHHSTNQQVLGTALKLRSISPELHACQG